MSLTKERQPCVITGPAQVWLLGVSMGNIGHTVKSQRQFCALQYVTLTTTPPPPIKKKKAIQPPFAIALYIANV